MDLNLIKQRLESLNKQSNNNSGGKQNNIYFWGNSTDKLSSYVNSWEGEFPVDNTKADGFERSAPVKTYPSNDYGLYEISGNVWEWTSDFNSVLISGESRQDVDTERNLFCGSASVNATNLMDYAAFMRYALRGSVKANYSLQTLGFRCAKSINKK